MLSMPAAAVSSPRTEIERISRGTAKGEASAVRSMFTGKRERAAATPLRLNVKLSENWIHPKPSSFCGNRGPRHPRVTLGTFSGLHSPWGRPTLCGIWVKRKLSKRRELSKRCSRARCSGSNSRMGLWCLHISRGRCGSISSGSCPETMWRWNSRPTTFQRRGSHSGQSSFRSFF